MRTAVLPNLFRRHKQIVIYIIPMPVQIQGRKQHSSVASNKHNATNKENMFSGGKREIKIYYMTVIF